MTGLNTGLFTPDVLPGIKDIIISGQCVEPFLKQALINGVLPRTRTGTTNFPIKEASLILLCLAVSKLYRTPTVQEQILNTIEKVPTHTQFMEYIYKLLPVRELIHLNEANSQFKFTFTDEDKKLYEYYVTNGLFRDSWLSINRWLIANGYGLSLFDVSLINSSTQPQVNSIYKFENLNDSSIDPRVDQICPRYKKSVSGEIIDDKDGNRRILHVTTDSTGYKSSDALNYCTNTLKPSVGTSAGNVQSSVWVFIAPNESTYQDIKQIICLKGSFKFTNSELDYYFSVLITEQGFIPTITYREPNRVKLLEQQTQFMRTFTPAPGMAKIEPESSETGASSTGPQKGQQQQEKGRDFTPSSDFTSQRIYSGPPFNGGRGLGQRPKYRPRDVKANSIYVTKNEYYSLLNEVRLISNLLRSNMVSKN